MGNCGCHGGGGDPGAAGVGCGCLMIILMVIGFIWVCTSIGNNVEFKWKEETTKSPYHYTNKP